MYKLHVHVHVCTSLVEALNTFIKLIGSKSKIACSEFRGGGVVGSHIKNFMICFRWFQRICPAPWRVAMIFYLNEMPPQMQVFEIDLNVHVHVVHCTYMYMYGYALSTCMFVHNC